VVPRADRAFRHRIVAAQGSKQHDAAREQASWTMSYREAKESDQGSRWAEVVEESEREESG
jgi:hypothetical protein